MAISEFRYEELQVDSAISALRRDGIFKLRGSAAAAEAVGRQHALLRENGYHDNPGAKWSDLCDFNGAERFQLPMLEVFTDPKVIDLGLTYLQSELKMSSTSISASIRTVDPLARINGAVPFHQDRAVIGTEQSLTFWYLLDPAETSDAVPGLDVVTGYRKDLARHAVLKVDAVPPHASSSSPVTSTDGKAEYYDMGIPKSARSLDTFHTPVVARGDVIVFDNYCPHRTAVGDGYSEQRTSLDVRLWRFDTRTAGSLIKAGHGLVVLFRQDWLQPCRKRVNGEGGDVFDHGTVAGRGGPTTANQRILARAFARARLQAQGWLSKHNAEDLRQPAADSEIGLETFAELASARFELALEDGRRFSAAIEVTDARGASLQQTYLGNGQDAAGTLEPADLMPLLSRARASGARFFGAAFLGDAEVGACELVFFDLLQGREKRMSGTAMRDRFGNYLCIDRG